MIVLVGDALPAALPRTLLVDLSPEEVLPA